MRSSAAEIRNILAERSRQIDLMVRVIDEDLSDELKLQCGSMGRGLASPSYKAHPLTVAVTRAC